VPQFACHLYVGTAAYFHAEVTDAIDLDPISIAVFKETDGSCALCLFHVHLFPGYGQICFNLSIDNLLHLAQLLWCDLFTMVKVKAQSLDCDITAALGDMAAQDFAQCRM